MKKVNETKNEVTKQKRARTQKVFFLYNAGKGFLAYDESGMPTFDCNKEMMRFNNKREAMFAADFCKKLHLVDSIDIMAKVG